MISRFDKRIVTMVSFFLLTFLPAQSQDNDRLEKTAHKKFKSWENPFPQWQNMGKPKLDSLKVDKKEEKITFYFGQAISYYPFREDTYNIFIESVKKSLGRKFKSYLIEPVTSGYSLKQLIPNYYRVQIPIDQSRVQPVKTDRPVLVKKENSFQPSNGLLGNSVALWHSHGYYFEMNLDRWEWQRARLFGTVEDISVMSYVQPYLTKMLENAGAGVFLPRERDTQINEVIVDNDKSTGNSEVVIHLNNNVKTLNEGFLLSDTIFPGINPFKCGTSLQILNDSALYIPEITENGYYAVYISFPMKAENSKSVKYVVLHTGGKTTFSVNQTIGGGTWVYLGTFNFKSGKNPGTGAVIVKGKPGMNEYIAIDAVKFGGGMGNVARKPSEGTVKNQQSAVGNQPVRIERDMADKSLFTWKLSGKARFLEAARYYLQYAGMPDTLIFSPTMYRNDYNDDYMSRGLWVNYLMGNPWSTTGKGLGIPIDVSFGFHTDAGITPNDSVIGTLAIYSTGADNGKFPDGTSRMASRDLSDIIQTQVVDDIRSVFDKDWTRRGLWDKPYAEARRPNVPATLLELLSHQNLADQKYGLDPRFRFEVSRSIYKGILKYQAYVENRKYVVQPVQVTNFALIPKSGKKIELTWEPGVDNLEPSSKPDKYKLYKRIGDNGFDNGVIVNSTSAGVELDSYNTIYSFKVTALNEGGESFDSEILAVGIIQDENDPVLVVNCFDRISGPAWFDENNMAGVAWWNDRGVPDHYEISGVGDQYDFKRNSPWLDDDSPGWGASYGDMEGKVIPGNSFDYPYIHGKAIMAAGHSFYSVSDEYFVSEKNNGSDYKTFDLIIGEEKSSPFFNDTSRIDFRIYTADFMKKISSLTEQGANIFMSGAYVGTDLFSTGDSTAIKFAGKYLHFFPRTGHAVKRGAVYTTDYVKPVLGGTLNFNTGYSGEIYSVEAPDAIEPDGKVALCALRYSETNASAGVIYNGINKTFVMGFPFETINSDVERNLLMKQILDFFNK